ncbi:serine/threonine protein phosphatase [Xenococcus sp. PCC 7305]|uniref:serine/threonine phosphatase n=1 Tax=Xenococcus sp. PCC 7305 TaxID=102125 RepID=UPI0002AC9947|nr:serine/threonine phosphatase [Xenococcus sp. PCC 7305]ELS03750.1 serine/threonine protein phosphatase [Xenococcus sp. PCC 7305]
MLICPECKYENSEHNKFCENCGTSLTHKTCSECGAEITYTAQECESCGAPNQTMLLAIIAQSNSPQAAEALSNENLSTPDDASYLDAQKRYYLPENKQVASNLADSHGNMISLEIIDQLPLQESYLNILRKTKQELFTDLRQALDDFYQTGNLAADLLSILPTQALPYLVLEEYAPIVPPIADAWQDQNQEVILLPARSQWQSLTELWSKPQLPLLQVLWSLGEMAKLWVPLSRSYCATSLLVQNNLKVDEDQSFCLEKLYWDSKEKQPTLADLVAKWHSWLIDSQQTYPEQLFSVLKQAIAGEILEIEDLLRQLHQIVEKEESNLDFDSTDTSPWSEPMDSDSWETVDDAEETDFFKIDSDEDSMIYESDADEESTAMLLMQIASVTHANYTDIGSGRDHNEDFFGSKTVITQEENPSEQKLEVKGLYIICDGMGGHAAGEVASAMAVETLQSYFHTYWQDELPSEKTIEEGILLANQIIYQTNIDNARSGSGRMGTTLVMALLQNNQLAIAHVGDSRIYKITRQEGLEQLTVDHEVGQREINRGVEPEIAYGRPDAYQLTQALGPRESKHLRPGIQYFDIEKDCLILLCSDGLSDNDLLEKHWQTYLEPLISSSSDLNSGIYELMTFADRYNGHDNLTGILIRIKLKPEI